MAGIQLLGAALRYYDESGAALDPAQRVDGQVGALLVAGRFELELVGFQGRVWYGPNARVAVNGPVWEGMGGFGGGQGGRGLGGCLYGIGRMLR